MREVAQQLLAEDARLRAEWRKQRRLAEELEEQWLADCEADQEWGESADAEEIEPNWVDTEIPF